MSEPDVMESLMSGVVRIPLRTPTLPPATRTNTYVVGDQRLCVVDPAPVDAEEQQKLAAYLQERRAPMTLVLTHHHRDHMSATAFLKEKLNLPVAAHAETASRVDVKVDIILSDGDALPCDGAPWKSVFTPGHAAGHLCFLREDDATMIAGDMVAGVGTILVDPDEGSMSQYMRSLERMRSLAPSTLLPAHGPALPDAVAHLTHYIQHRQARAEAVLQRLHAGDREPEDMVPHIYLGVPTSFYGMAARSVLSILMQHAEEGRASRDAAGAWRAL